MRYLRLYKNDSDFKSYEDEAGGTGIDVESVVPGIVKTLDERKMYFNPHDNEIRVHTVTVNYKSVNGEVIAPSTTKKIKYIPGVKQEIMVLPIEIDGFEQIDISKKITIPEVNSVTFLYYSLEELNKYLTFNITKSGSIIFSAQNPATPKRTIEYSKNNGATWIPITSSYYHSSSIPVNAGDNVMFKGDNETYGEYSAWLTFGSSTAGFTLEGNIMSLIKSNNFSTVKALKSEYTFFSLFDGCTGLTSAENLVLPATTLTDYCYYSMFYGCTSLAAAPLILPAETLPARCYLTMFSHCSSLTSVPILNAKKVGYWSCCQMFDNCESLTTAPELPATTLAEECYLNMFSGCRSLTTAPELPATTLARGCYNNMFGGCRSLTTAPELPATTLVERCYYNMFKNCIALKTAPVLQAATLMPHCYEQMFSGCTSLNYIKCLATDISASSATTNWVTGVATYGIFIKNPSQTEWTKGANGVPSSWILEDESQYTEQYLTFNIISSGTINWVATDSSFTKTIYYSTNSGKTWLEITSTTAGTPINVNDGDIIMFKGDEVKYTSGSSTNTFSGSTAIFSLEGNIMSLRNSSGFSTMTTITGTASEASAFTGFFSYCTGLTSAENLVIRLDNLAYYFYYGLFRGCISLTKAPVLSSLVIENNSYAYMFEGCVSLGVAPDLPAYSIGSASYYSMFSGCTSLRNAPTIAFKGSAPDSCFAGMFMGCTSLITAPELLPTSLGYAPYAGMFNGCTSLVNPPSVLPSTSLTYGSYSNMFQDCVSLVSAPVICATTTSLYSLNAMFQGCTSLTQAPEIKLNYIGLGGCQFMFSGCTSLTAAPSLSGATSVGEFSCWSMFAGCTSLTTVPSFPATTYLSKSCYQEMFLNCTSLTTVPELPATKLLENCYDRMFNGCTSLNYIKCLATNISASLCTAAWVNGVASSGTFVKNPSMTSWTTGIDGIPANWTVQDA